MGVLVALGESALVEGFGLAGATVMCADDPDSVRRAWASLPEDAEVVLLTPNAAAVLSDSGAPREELLTAVMPS